VKIKSPWQQMNSDDDVQEKGALMAPSLSAGAFWAHVPMFFYYQPIVSLASGSIYGVEALIRTRGLDGRPTVPAGDLNRLYYSNREGIVDFDRFVLARNIQFLVKMHENGCPKRISINVSGVSFSENCSFLLEFVQECLLRHNRPDLIKFIDLEIVEWLEFEINEMVMMRVQACRDAGMGVCLDDAGTGNVGLDTFVSLPFSCLKIDRVFVQKMPVEEKAFYVAKGFTETAKSLNIRVVAEGVETEEQVELLLELGVDYAQGFYFHRPMSGEDLLLNCK